MNISSIKNVITSKVARQILVTQKNSPMLLFGSGIVGIVATVVLASRATLNLDATLQVTQDKLEQAESLHDQGHASYTDKDWMQDKAILRVRAITSIAKLYAPAIVVGVVSIGALSGSHIILTKRNIGLTAAYAAIEKGFAEYRERVLGEVGVDKERELRYGTENREILEETSKGPKVSTVKRVGPDGASIYARFFDNRSSSWSPQPEYNLLFLRAQQNYANDRLRARGHVLLNDVYDSLGIERTKAGCVVGWVRNNDGDNFVDFGIFEGQHMDRMYDFVRGYEGSILLDFNVDGVIYDKI